MCWLKKSLNENVICYGKHETENAFEKFFLPLNLRPIFTKRDAMLSEGKFHCAMDLKDAILSCWARDLKDAKASLNHCAIFTRLKLKLLTHF